MGFSVVHRYVLRAKNACMLLSLVAVILFSFNLVTVFGFLNSFSEVIT